jgi:hypothetical protein
VIECSPGTNLTSSIKNLEVVIGKQSVAPFRFLVRPITTVNVASRDLSGKFEDAILSSFEGLTFSSPISGILVLPTIIDRSIAAPPPDYVGYKRGDNSVSVGINVDFSLWQHSSELERIRMLAENIRCSLDRIKSRYLIGADREQLYQIVDKVEAQLSSRLQG